MADTIEVRELGLYVNSKIPDGTFTQGPRGGRWVKSGTIAIPEWALYHDHSTIITAKNPPDDPNEYGHQVYFDRRQGDGKILAVVLSIYCENHSVFAAGRWYGVTLRVKVRFEAARDTGSALEPTDINLIES